MPEPPPQGPGNTEARLLWLEKQAADKAGVDIDQLPWQKVLRKLEATWHPDADALFDGSIAFGGATANAPANPTTLVGPWPTAVPGATTGTPLNIPVAGTYAVLAFASAFVAVAGVANVQVFIDGVFQASATAFVNEVGSHNTLVPAVFSVALTAGQHYIAYRQTAGTSSVDDQGGFTAVRIG